MDALPSLLITVEGFTIAVFATVASVPSDGDPIVDEAGAAGAGDVPLGLIPYGFGVPIGGDQAP